MAQRERLLSRGKSFFSMVMVIFLIHACKQEDVDQKKSTSSDAYVIAVVTIPKDTVSIHDKRLLQDNGVYYVDGKRYAGVITSFYADGKIKSYASVYNGMLAGVYKSFYEDGNPFEVRHYSNNVATGKHSGYWPGTAILKFEYNYRNEKREGPQKKWYKNGRPYLFANYANDHEEGLQQGWRENGKLFINYVAKDGHTYGLQQTALCYTILNENIKEK